MTTGEAIVWASDVEADPRFDSPDLVLAARAHFEAANKWRKAPLEVKRLFAGHIFVARIQGHVDLGRGLLELHAAEHGKRVTDMFGED